MFPLHESRENILLYDRGLKRLWALLRKEPHMYALMETRRKQLLKSSDELSPLLNKHLSHIENLWNQNSFNKMNAFTTLPLYFQRWPGGGYAPLLKESARLNFKLKTSAVEQLLKFFSRSSFSEKISCAFRMAKLDDNDFNFRSDLIDGKLIIMGQDLGDFRSLVGLAHELGHILTEADNPLLLTTEQRLAGEIAAFHMENVAATAAIQSHQEAKNHARLWKEETKLMDDLNHYFCLEEQSRVDEIFNRESLFFRQSLYCTPGYQSIYSMASLKRDQHIFRDCSCEYK